MAVGVAGVAAALAVAGLALQAPQPSLVFGIGLGSYMLGATVLLVLGAEGMLLAGLAPGVLGSVSFLLLGRPATLRYADWAALAATPLLVTALAMARARRAAGRSGAGRSGAHSSGARSRLVAGAELRAALPSAGFGLVAAGLLVFPVAAGLPGGHGVNIGAVLASLPLALSMGVAEWLLIWFRRQAQRLLRGTRSLLAFTTRARLALITALAVYLLATAALIFAVAWIASAARLVHPHWVVLPEAGAYLALGGAMFLALLLQAFGNYVVPLTACGAALAFEVGWPGLGVLGQVTASTALLIVMAGYAVPHMGTAIRHAL
jgi:hypothetical protein